MTCQCQNLGELDEEEAKPYIAEHLQLVDVNMENWAITYKCPDTGIRWVRYYPHPDWPGGGPWRLRKVGD
ncbi:MAG: hypothetical protein KIS91_00470 [Anaerolineae bacterium]|nr:hypothetical protein [Anaerolineae bacterium]